MQPDGQPRTRPKFPPKLRWRARPRSSESRSTGSGAGCGAGAGPGAQAARSRRSRSRAPGQTAGAGPHPQPGGGAVPGTQPLPTPAQRGAEPRTRGSLAPGSPARGGGWQPRRGAHPSPPVPPTRKRQRAGAPGGWLPAPLSSSDLGRSREGVSFSSNRPSTLSSFPQPLPCSATSQTDRQETQRRKQNKTKLPPLGSHPPAWSREDEEERAHSSSSPSDSGIRADSVSKEPRGGP